MKSMALRQHLITIIIDSGVYEPPSSDDQQAFINDELDIELERLDIDSLASMEICIGIELEMGVSIVPTQLSQLRTLKGLEQEIIGYKS